MILTKYSRILQFVFQIKQTKRTFNLLPSSKSMMKK